MFKFVYDVKVPLHLQCKIAICKVYFNSINILKFKTMPKFEGIFNIAGTMQGMTFYKTKDGQMVKTKGGISKERISKDPAFQRTRENGSEFGHCAKMSQLLRNSISDKVDLAKDYRTSSRLNQSMSVIKNLDDTSFRGERTVWNGLQKPEGKAVLTGFDFNSNSKISQIFKANYLLDTDTGTLSFENFEPRVHLQMPEGATEADLQLICTKVDFEAGNYATAESARHTALPGDSAGTLSLVIPTAPTGTGTAFWLLLAAFYQTVNGVRYPLKNKQYNAMAIIAVE